MKNTLRQILHSPKFMCGFVLFVLILLFMFIYPLFNPGSPLEMIGVGTFAKPGTYVNVYDAAGSRTETLRLADADAKRIAVIIGPEGGLERSEVEALIEKGMDQLMEGRTVFVIAHRLSTVQNSNVIMVLDHGRIIERGTHEELIELGGTYSQLYSGVFELE